jgi:hypothetical protein
MRLHDDPKCPIDLIASRLGFDPEEVRAMLSRSVRNDGRHENGEPNEGRAGDLNERNCDGYLTKSSRTGCIAPDSKRVRSFFRCMTSCCFLQATQESFSWIRSMSS